MSCVLFSLCLYETIFHVENSFEKSLQDLYKIPISSTLSLNIDNCVPFSLQCVTMCGASSDLLPFPQFLSHL